MDGFCLTIPVIMNDLGGTMKLDVHQQCIDRSLGPSEKSQSVTHRSPFPIGWLMNKGLCFSPLENRSFIMPMVYQSPAPLPIFDPELGSCSIWIGGIPAVPRFWPSSAEWWTSIWRLGWLPRVEGQEVVTCPRLCHNNFKNWC